MALTKKIRFEVFKRDSFKCQYCGRSAPDVVLQADHIAPKSKGGKDDIMNLITSCFDCNMGKSDRELSDNTVVKKRKKQSDDLQERREQIEMMMEWHKSLVSLDEETTQLIRDYFKETSGGWSLNENGDKTLRHLIRNYTVQIILESIRISCDKHLVYEDGKVTLDSAAAAWNYVAKVCRVKKSEKDKPYLKELFYIRGILRNRFNMYPERMGMSLTAMERAHINGVSLEDIALLAKSANNYSEFIDTLEGMTNG